MKTEDERKKIGTWLRFRERKVVELYESEMEDVNLEDLKGDRVNRASLDWNFESEWKMASGSSEYVQ